MHITPLLLPSKQVACNLQVRLLLRFCALPVAGLLGCLILRFVRYNIEQEKQNDKVSIYLLLYRSS